MAYPEFVIGGVYRFVGKKERERWGDWTVTDVRNKRVYASVSTAFETSRNQCMVEIDTPIYSGYEVERVDDEPVIEEDWS